MIERRRVGGEKEGERLKESERVWGGDRRRISVGGEGERAQLLASILNEKEKGYRIKGT